MKDIHYHTCLKGWEALRNLLVAYGTLKRYSRTWGAPYTKHLYMLHSRLNSRTALSWKSTKRWPPKARWTCSWKIFLKFIKQTSRCPLILSLNMCAWYGSKPLDFILYLLEKDRNSDHLKKNCSSSSKWCIKTILYSKMQQTKREEKARGATKNWKSSRRKWQSMK